MDLNTPSLILKVYLIGGLINNLRLGVVESVIPRKYITIFVNIPMK